jgi:hypothetical protein
LGIGGGLICNPVNGALRPEAKGDPRFHVRGATKIYRHACWQAIGGLIRRVGWDTVDELRANMLGWRTRTFEDVPIVHHRQAGGAYGAWANWTKNGRAAYVTGYHPLFMFAKCVKRFIKRPHEITALGLWVGFCGGYLRGLPQVNDPALTKYVRKQQINRLLLRPSLWS